MGKLQLANCRTATSEIRRLSKWSDIHMNGVCGMQASGNGSVYIVRYHIRWNIQNALHFTP